MKVVVDKDIPFIKETLGFQPFRDVVVIYVAPTEITNKLLKERKVDAMIIRTRNKVDEELLRDTSIKFVASATIGLDHIDTVYCEKHSIFFTSCPGCNAQAVCDYVQEVLDSFRQVLPPNPTLGVVGYGHIGSLVVTMAQKKGFSILYNDSPKHLGVPLEKIAQKSDIITFHVPLTTSPPHPTYHLGNKDFFRACKPGVIIVNASRGGVLDEIALLESVHQKKIGGVAIDCWENEPHINKDLLQISIPHIFSYHIAGYSIQGKYNASQMCIDALSSFYNLPSWTIDKKLLNLRLGDSKRGWLTRVTGQLESAPDDFEKLRTNYVLR